MMPYESRWAAEVAKAAKEPRDSDASQSNARRAHAVQAQLPISGTLRIPAVDDADDMPGAADSARGAVNRPLDMVKNMPTDLLGREYETFPAPKPLHQHGPARIIAMCNQKGGVGKTTSSINIGGALSQYGRRVLIVDFDPQGAATVGLGINANTVENTVYTALFDTSIDVHEIVQHTEFENLDIMPANIDLSAAEVQLVTEVGREQILASVLRQVRNEYDVIIIDCQPSLGLLTVNALTAADGVIIPVAAEFFALRGVALLMQSIDKVRSRINPSLEVYGVLVTMYTRTLHCEEVLQRIYEAFQEKVFHSVISRSIKLPDANVAAAPITVYAPGHKTAKEYREVARELIARGIVA
jgi:chromosome partitioning protein